MTQRYNRPADYFDDLRRQERRDRRVASVILTWEIVSAVFGILLLLMVGAALAQEREFTLRMNSADLQVLDAAINKAPLPREMTQPFVAKMQAQIVEQSKPKDEPKPSPAVNLPATPETGAAAGAPPGVGTQTPPK